MLSAEDHSRSSDNKNSFNVFRVNSMESFISQRRFMSMKSAVLGKANQGSSPQLCSEVWHSFRFKTNCEPNK